MFQRIANNSKVVTAVMKMKKDVHHNWSTSAHLSEQRSLLQFIDHSKQRELFESCYQGQVIRARSLLLNGQVAANAKYLPHKHGTIGGLSIWGSGSTCLIFAAYKGRVDVVRMLVRDFDANVHQPDDDYGCTALLYAAYFGQLSVIRALLEEFGADLAHKGCDGRTALMKAVERGKHNVAEYLLQQGANVNERDATGKTALSLVDRDLFCLSRRMLDILKTHGATV